MRDTIWKGKKQKLVERDPLTGEKRNKGLRKILKERNLWPKPPKRPLKRDEAREVLKQCPDFQQEKSTECIGI